MTDSPQRLQEGLCFCSQQARAAGAQLFGTAVEAVQVWLALEYPRAWGRDALRESDLPERVKHQLNGWLDALPGLRMQFIRQKERATADPAGITCFLATADDEAPCCRLRLGTYEELLSLDLPALATGRPEGMMRHDAPLFLVCTNGKRDRCCAKWGRRLFTALRAEADAAVWQTTHLGGHRFAPTMVCLPEGVCYGRLEAGEAAMLVRAHRRGRIHRLDRYRGRTCYTRPVQAAEYYLRRETGIMAITSIRLYRTQRVEEDVWHVDFICNEHVHTVRVRETQSEAAYPLSCRSDTSERVPQYALLHHEEMGAGVASAEGPPGGAK